MANEQDAVSALIRMMNSTASIEVRAAAAEGLGYAGGSDARAQLIRMMNSTASIEVRSAAARALGRAAQR